MFGRLCQETCSEFRMNLGHLVNKQEQASWWGREHRLIDAKIKAWASLITGPTAPEKEPLILVGETCHLEEEE